MRRNWILGTVIALWVIGGLTGCATRSPLSRMSPILPLESYEGEFADIIVDTETKPQPTLELTKKNVTVRIQYWRRADLDRKFYRGNSLSAFYSPTTWKQGERVDVWWVTIINNNDRPLRVKLTDFYIEDDLKLRPDMDGNIYKAVPEEENRRRLLYKKGQTLDVKNGLEAVRPYLFETHLINNEVPPKSKVEGYLPFFSIKPNAKKLMIHIPVELAPESDIGRYQKIEFVFPMRFDLAIYEAQPATVRR